MTQARYQIRVRGELASDWADWLGDATVTTGADGNSMVVGTCVDDAALYGVVNALRDLGLSLLRVEVVE